MKLVAIDSETVDLLLARVSAHATSRDNRIGPSDEQAQTTTSAISESAAETSADPVRDVELDGVGSEARLEARVAEATPVESATKRVDGHDDGENSRSVHHRVSYPLSWEPEPVTKDLSAAFENAIETLKSIVKGPGQRFAVLAGSDVARDLVLRKLFHTVFTHEPGRYVDLFAYRYPEDESLEFPSALIIDGLDAVSLEDEEEQRAMLSDISRAFSSRVPFVAGVRRPPAESKSLLGGLKLTLGLGKLVKIEINEHSVHSHEVDLSFERLVDETIRWSKETFPGAGLQSLLGTVMDRYKTGDKKGAVATGSTAVAARITHLTKR
jgi:hypothetical protein